MIRKYSKEGKLFNNYSPKANKVNVVAKIFTEPEKNNCFSVIIITQVIITATAFPFILFVSSSETSFNKLCEGHFQN